MDAKARIRSAAKGFWEAPLGGSFRELDEKISALTSSGYNDIGGHDAVPHRSERYVPEE